MYILDYRFDLVTVQVHELIKCDLERHKCLTAPARIMISPHTLLGSYDETRL